MARIADPYQRQVILQAARKVFLQKGYREARMADIALEAGVAAGTLYRHFDSKETLAQTLAENFFERLATELSPLLSIAKGAEVLPQLVTKVFYIAEEYRDILAIAPQNLGERSGTVIRQPRFQFVKKLATVLEDRMEQGIVRRYDPQALADMVTVLIQRLVMGCLIWGEAERIHYESTVIQILRLSVFEKES
jgi:TetR/AcrR family transcriptional regulator, fatty acid metabolism regulator protein